MRDRKLTLARFFVLVLAALAGIGCGSTAGRVDPGLGPIESVVVEQAIFVDLPVGDNITQAQWNEYKRGKIVGQRRGERCIEPRNALKQCDNVVPLDIGAVEGSIHAVPTKPGTRPQLLAWIDNRGSKTTSEGIKPKSQARYALVLGADLVSPINRRRLYIVEFHFFLGLGRPSYARAAEYGFARICHKTEQPPYKSDVYYMPCGRMHAIDHLRPFQIGQPMATGLLSHAAQFIDDPVWFTCTSGCCSSAN